MKTLRRAGVREVKAQLSEFLHRVQGGETVLITSHGRVIAELRPHNDGPKPGRAEIERVLGEMVAEGKAIPPRKPTGKLALPKYKLNVPKGTAQKLLDAEREERL